MTAVRADGSEFPVELAITRIPLDGPPSFTGYLRDTTARKQADQNLRASELSLRQLTETIPEMLWSASPQKGRSITATLACSTTPASLPKKSWAVVGEHFFIPTMLNGTARAWMILCHNRGPVPSRGSHLPRCRSHLPMVRNERAPAAR